MIIKTKYGSQQLFNDFRTKSPENSLCCFFPENLLSCSFRRILTLRFIEPGLGYFLEGTELNLGYLTRLLRQIPAHLGYEPILMSETTFVNRPRSFLKLSFISFALEVQQSPPKRKHCKIK
jgi:hypothetical protein